MKAALLQMSPAFLQTGANLQRAVAMMEAAAADLYVLPELFPSGYTFARTDEVEAIAEEAAGGPSFEALAGFAQRHSVHVIYGFAERKYGKFFNSANLVGPDGVVTTYRKIHLFGREKLFFAPGTDPAPVSSLPWGRVGLMICFDWYFPELARSLALRGAELIVQPANLVLPNCPDAMITRSLENRVFSITCDRVGKERNGEIEYEFIGRTQAVSPKGKVLERLSADREEMAVVEMDLSLARNKGVSDHNDLFADRRTSLYV